MKNRLSEFKVEIVHKKDIPNSYSLVAAEIVKHIKVMNEGEALKVYGIAQSTIRKAFKQEGIYKDYVVSKPNASINPDNAVFVVKK